MKKLVRGLAVSLVALSAAVAAHAQSYPDKPVRIVVPYPAGGTTDILARVAAVQLGQRV